mmetsp:Transcript_19167/g.35763  ORF Transcript_19167/g.35763 Transcript_19167/m.35763 type:complete len:86 (-) Transcript_19167:597-854(-)
MERREDEPRTEDSGGFFGFETSFPAAVSSMLPIWTPISLLDLHMELADAEERAWSLRLDDDSEAADALWLLSSRRDSQGSLPTLL